MHAIRRHPKTVLGGTVVGVLALAGAAVAAVLLTSSLTGTVSASSKTASDQLRHATVVGHDDLDCTPTIIEKGEQIALTAAADEVVAAPGQSAGGQTGDDLSGTCTVAVDLVNTGEVPLYINGLDYANQLPAEWKFVNPSLPSGEIGVGDAVTFQVTLKATNDAAAEGQFSASVVTSTSNS